MKKWFLILFSLSAAAMAADSPITAIEGATLVCEQQGGAYSINATIGKERVWQSEPGDKSGLELQVTRVQRYRCPQCYVRKFLNHRRAP